MGRQAVFRLTVRPDGSADLIRVKDGRFAATIPAEFVEGLSQALGLGISVKEERQ